jgi:hypothetical protein
MSLRGLFYGELFLITNSIIKPYSIQLVNTTNKLLYFAHRDQLLNTCFNVVSKYSILRVKCVLKAILVGMILRLFFAWITGMFGEDS